MKATTATYKQIIASRDARHFVHKIDLVLADETELHLDGNDIWQDSFSIETASSGTSSFDIGTAVIGQCKFTINNIDGDFDGYDFYNATATVWLGLLGDEVNETQQYYRMGFYTVDEPKKATGLISLTLLDNMWKFDRPLSGVTINYPATCLTIIQTICTYCGVTLSGTSASFHGYNFTVSEAPKDVENMNCREMLQYCAMIGCNFCYINESGNLEIKWYDVNATASTTDVFDTNMSSTFNTDEITITGVKFVVDNTAHTIGTAGYVLELQNPLVNASNVNTVLNLIWDVLEGFTLRPYTLTTASDLAVEIGDKCKIKDYKGNDVYSWVTLNTFKTAGHQVQCNAQAPNRQLVTRYSKTVQAAVEEARKIAGEELSNYDLAVQMMNTLAVNAMGGYEEYEDVSTGGRVWYLSNMPITKNPTTGVCTFEANSTVYKKSGSGFWVSRDGGQTWVNGYDMTTGELVVNVLDAIGINFDWARGGTLTLGGYNNGNGVLSIQDASGVEKVHGDNLGLKVGGTTGSKVFIDTLGQLQYYFDNTYAGKLRMKTSTYESQSVDTFSVEDFNHVEIFSEDTAWVSGNNVAIGRTMYPTPSNETIVSLEADNIRIHGGAIRFDFSSIQGITDEYWHSWYDSQNDTWYSAIILAAGVSQAQFPDINRNLTYDPYIQSADGTDAPLLEGISYSGTTCTVKFTEVTAAQAAGGACVIKLLAKVIRNN